MSDATGCNPANKTQEPHEERHFQIQNAIRFLGWKIDEIDRFIDEVENGPTPPSDKGGETEVAPSLATVLDNSAESINKAAARIPDQLIRLRGLLF